VLARGLGFARAHVSSLVSNKPAGRFYLERHFEEVRRESGAIYWSGLSEAHIGDMTPLAALLAEEVEEVEPVEGDEGGLEDTGEEEIEEGEEEEDIRKDI
jgi:hypothetical protein